MSEKNSWEKDFPETPESFRMALKEMVEKEIADDEIEVKVNDGTNHVKGKINKRNTSICKIDEAVQMFQIEGGEWLK